MDNIPEIDKFSADTDHFVLKDAFGRIYNCNCPVEISIRHENVVRVINTLWLYLYLRFKISSEISLDDIQFVKIDNTFKKFPYKCIFTKPYIVNSCYRIIPSFSRYAISANGTCINRYTLHKLTARVNAYGYAVISLKDPVTDEYRDVGIHWLIANAWINKNQNSSAVTVNHKDLNKLNNTVDNLEWATYKANVNHAKHHGVVGKLVGVELMSILTHEVLHFNNMTSAAAYLNIDVSVIKAAKFNNKHTILDKWYIKFILNTDNSYIPPSDGRNRKIPIEVCKDGKYIGIVKSLRELHAKTGICRTALSRLLNSNGKYSLYGYSIRRMSNEQWPVTKDISQYKAVEVIDRSGTTSRYPSIKDASIALRVNKSTIKRMIKHPCTDDLVKVKLIST